MVICEILVLRVRGAPYLAAAANRRRRLMVVVVAERLTAGMLVDAAGRRLDDD